MENDKYNHDDEVLGYQKIDSYDDVKISSVATHYKDILASTENLAIAIWDILAPHINESGAQLHCIKIYETENNFVEYFG